MILIPCKSCKSTTEYAFQRKNVNMQIWIVFKENLDKCTTWITIHEMKLLACIVRIGKKHFAVFH